jgi:glycosyltransferase involved in cell wall biosynthesis
MTHRVLLWHWGRQGAGAKFTYELANHLKDIGPEITLSSARGSDLGQIVKNLRLPNETVRTFEGDKATFRGKLAAAIGLAGILLISLKFRRILRKHSVEVALCTFQSIWDVATLPVLAYGSVRSVLILHDAFFHPGDGYPFRHHILRAQIANTDALIVLSDHVKQQAITAFAYPADRIWKMPHGAFTFGNKNITQAVHPRGKRPVRILFFGRIVTYKGLNHLLSAVKMLITKVPAFQVIIAGSGSLEAYADLISDLPNLEIHNRWLNDSDIGTLLASADVAILPYIEASQSGVAAAAYAAGRPIIATPVGGLVEQVLDNVTGLLAQDMTVHALAETITKMIMEPDLLDRLAIGAFDHAQGTLNWSHSAEIVDAIIHTVTMTPRRRIKV